MIFVGTLDAQNARERLSGIKEVLKGSKVEIIDTRTDDTDRVRAKANVLDTLVKYPDVSASSDYGATMVRQSSMRRKTRRK